MPYPAFSELAPMVCTSDLYQGTVHLNLR